uniref:Uncharacterized protein n=1 Tax=viral metagenome TaxID=1070528 RepID=A0A6H2A3K7_9ZZZZ
MPKEPEERYMEWLQREEELWGIVKMQRATTDEEELRELLYSELGYEPTESQVSSFMQFGKARYEIMPEVGVTSARFDRPYGYQQTYRDVATGRFISYTETSRRIGEYWKGWEY